MQVDYRSGWQKKRKEKNPWAERPGISRNDLLLLLLARTTTQKPLIIRNFNKTKKAGTDIEEKHQDNTGDQTIQAAFKGSGNTCLHPKINYKINQDDQRPPW